MIKKFISKVKTINDKQFFLVVAILGVLMLYLALWSATAAMSAELPEGLTEIPGGGYVILQRDGKDLAFIVHTWDGLTMDKASVYDSDDKRTKQNAIPKAQELAERLLKIEDVSKVFITYKKVEVYRFPLGKSLEELAPDIEKAFFSVFEEPKYEGIKPPAEAPKE